MTEYHPNQSPENENKRSKYENGSSYPRTLEDFKLRAAEIEQERDIMRALFVDAGHVPEAVPAYTHLTGRLAAVHEQIIAMETEGFEQQFIQ